MKAITISTGLLLLACCLAAFAGDDEPKTFRGEISDSQCALNVHSLTQSHEEMLKSKSGEAGKTAASCSQYCVMHLGGKFVLASKTHVYHLDNQEMPRGFIGEKVKVHGVLDPKTETIHVLDVQAD